jgi:prolyl-tRNA synthetase
MRWELRTRLFLRTGEFLWQEGHTAHATHDDAREEVKRMLDVYATFAEEWMAMPVVRGQKSDSEKFAGALHSYCIEAMMQDGKALQAGTSHDLGQNFGKAFNVKFQNQEGQMDYVWQTSWGVSTRLIGGLVMTHSDDNGLVLPPKLAPIHVAIVPIMKAGTEAAVSEAGEAVARELKAQGLSVVFDTRDYKPGFKYFEWEQKGVPLRIEIGPKDVEKGSVALKDRLADKKEFWSRDGLGPRVVEHLDAFQQRLFAGAQKRREQESVEVNTWDDFAALFAGQGSKFVYAHWDGTVETEARIKEQTKATIRCIPENAPAEPGACVLSGRPSARRVLFAKAY